MSSIPAHWMRFYRIKQGDTRWPDVPTHPHVDAAKEGLKEGLLSRAKDLSFTDVDRPQKGDLLDVQGNILARIGITTTENGLTTKVRSDA